MYDLGLGSVSRYDAAAKADAFRDLARPKSALADFGLAQARLVQLQVQNGDDDRAGEEQPEEQKERPAEAEVSPCELWIHQRSTGSSAAAVKSSAR